MQYGTNFSTHPLRVTRGFLPDVEGKLVGKSSTRPPKMGWLVRDLMAAVAIFAGRAACCWVRTRLFTVSVREASCCWLSRLGVVVAEFGKVFWVTVWSW